MSRYFVLPEEGIGPGGDITFRRRTNGYLLYVGDVMFGELFKLRAWAGVSYNQNESEFFPRVRSMEGFATRMDAASFIIKHHGYWMHNERETRRFFKITETTLFKMKVYLRANPGWHNQHEIANGASIRWRTLSQFLSRKRRRNNVILTANNIETRIVDVPFKGIRSEYRWSGKKEEYDHVLSHTTGA